jgi:hypothetical protein
VDEVLEKVEECFNLEEILGENGNADTNHVEEKITEEVNASQDIKPSDDTVSEEPASNPEEVHTSQEISPSDEIVSASNPEEVNASQEIKPSDDIVSEEQASNAEAVLDTDIDISKDDSVQDVEMELESGQEQKDIVLDSATTGADMDLVENLEEAKE